MKKAVLLLGLIGLCFIKSVTAQNDTTRINESIKAIGELIRNDIQLARQKAIESIKLAEKVSNKKFYYKSTLALADICYFNDEEDTVVKLLEPLLKSIPKEVDERTMGGIYYRLASSYSNLFKFEKGLSFSFKALTFWEKIKDSTKIVNSLVNIAGIYQQQGNFKESNKQYLHAETIAKLLKNKTALGNVYNSWSILYAENNKPDSALVFALASVKIREALNDQTSIVWNYNNLGGIYMMREDWKNAMRWYEKAMKRFEETENYSGQGTVYSNLAEIHLNLKNYPEALNYFNRSRALFSKINNPDLLENLYRNYMIYYNKTGQFDKATLYADSLISFKDSLFSNTLSAKMAEMQTKFEVEKKDLEIVNGKIKLESTEKQNTIKNIIIIGIVCLFVLAGLLGFTFYKRKKAEQEAKLSEELAKQKEIRSKAIIEAEEKERIRIARDLHDGVGQLLSATKLNMSQLQSHIQVSTPEAESALQNTLSLLDDSVKEVRIVSHNMMPNTLLKMGLVSAVREFVSRIQNAPSLKVNLEIVGLDQRLEQSKEAILYRVIQELVNNIIKHAKANQITLQIINEDKELTIMIEDNGIGFDTSKMENFEGIGIKNIISRIEYVNGQVFFDSTPGKGTTVVIELKA